MEELKDKEYIITSTVLPIKVLGKMTSSMEKVKRNGQTELLMKENT